MKDKFINGVTGGLVAGAMLLLTSCGNAQQVTATTTPVVQAPVTQSELDLVTVSGKAEIKVVPDKASISAGFAIRDSAVESVSETLDNRVAALRNRLLASGVKETDISTEGYDIYPEYKWTNDERKMTGYVGTSDITISGVDIKDISKILKIVTDSGIDTVGNISYYSSEYKTAYDDALCQAIVEARTKADNMGEAAGFVVARVHEMTEGRQNDSMAYVTNNARSAMADGVAMESATAAVVPGEVSVEARVEVTYVIE